MKFIVTILKKNLVYSSTSGVVSERNFSALVSHLFNHQTHHRGQLSAVLHQLNINVGITDFFINIPDLKT
ncbi:DinB family protein [Moritella dasanensis]|uniref:DinB family protein n=1 Tax=Moritella dasanensis TaxID=428031 RepID=UPI000A00902D|nr:DinB family protein [Moritella dasanensis]